MKSIGLDSPIIWIKTVVKVITEFYVAERYFKF